MKNRSLTEIARDESYHALMDKDTRKQAVCKVIKRHGPISNREISIILKLPINSITGRVKELRGMGLVTIHGRIYDSLTDRRVTTFKVNDDINF